MKTKIYNVTIVTMDEKMHIFEDASLIMEDDTIIAINDEKMEYDQLIDGKNGILLPGMINCHSHLAMIPFRSLGDDTHDRLRRFLFPLEYKAMTKELVYYATRYACSELLLGGVTSVFDMYYFEEEAFKAALDMGIRGIFAETVINIPTCDSEEIYGGLEYAEKYIQKWKDYSPLVKPAIAPHAPNTNNKESLIRSKQIADQYNTKLMIHVAEMDYEMAYFKDEYNMTPVEYLDSIGLLDENVIAVHCVHTNDSDIKLLKKTKTAVAHCPSANTKGGKGVMPFKKMQEENLLVGLGSDGPISGNTIDLFAKLPLIPYFQKAIHRDRTIFTSDEALKTATIDGAKVLGIDHLVGSLEVGKKADMILVETESVNMYPIHDYYATLVYSANARNVSKVWVNGKLLVDDHKLTEHDLKDIRNDLEKHMKDFREMALVQAKSTM